MESGAWQAAHPFKEAEEEKRDLFRDKEGWEKGGNLRVCLCLSKSWDDVATCRKKSVLTKQPFPKCTHIMPESRNSLWYVQGITNCFT